MDKDNIREICTYCGKGFTDVQKFNTHLRYHRNANNYRCQQCNKTFRSKSILKQHQYIHTGVKPHECDKCEKSFAFYSSYKRHAEIHKDPSARGTKPFKCYECGKTFTLFRSLKRHDNHVHRKRKENKSVCSNKTEETLGMTSQPDDNHKYSNDRKYPYPNAKPYKCKVCGRCFMKFNNFKIHQQNHSGVKLFSCDKCDKTFARTASLLMHMHTHGKEKPHQCKECGKSFRHSGSLSNHKYIHTGRKPYICELCKKAFPKPCLLVRHKCPLKPIEIEEKPPNIEKSEVALVKKERLVKRTPTVSKEKLYKCGQCGKAFKNESTLRDHSLWHSKRVVIPCGECGTVFSSRQMHLSHKCSGQTDKAVVNS